MDVTHLKDEIKLHPIPFSSKFMKNMLENLIWSKE